MRSVPSFGVCLAQMVLSVLAVPSCGITGEKTAPPAKAEDPTVPKGDPRSKEAIDAWIRQLGDARFTVRESAKRALIAAGPHAMAAVLQAAKSMDLELKRRADGIAKQIEANAAKVLEGFGADVQRRRADGSVRVVYFLRSRSKDSKLTDADLVQLQAFPTLEHLTLENDKISDEGLKYLGQRTSLTFLVLQGTKVSDAGLRHLMGLDRLTSLDLAYTNVKGSGLVHLKSLTSLKTLYLCGCQVRDAELAKGVVGLKELKNLRSLLLGQSDIRDSLLAHLKQLKSLTSVYLDDAPITDAGLVHLKALPKLSYLDLSSTGITDAGLIHLSTMKELGGLRLQHTRVTARGLKELAGLPKLVRVDVAGQYFQSAREAIEFLTRPSPPKFAVIKEIDRKTGEVVYEELYDSTVEEEPVLPGLKGRTKLKFFRPVIKRLLIPFSVKNEPVYTEEGKRLSAEEALKRISVGTMVMLSTDGKEVDKAYLKVLKLDTLILVPQPPQPGPGNAEP